MTFTALLCTIAIIVGLMVMAFVWASLIVGARADDSAERHYRELEGVE